MKKLHLIFIILFSYIAMLTGCGEGTGSVSATLSDEAAQEEESGQRKLTGEERSRVQDEKHISVYEKTIEVEGLEKDADILFIADMHISLCDERDAELLEKAVSRGSQMVDADGRPAYQTFHEFIDYANTIEPDLLILGGDILDSAMLASVDFLKSELKTLKVPYMYVLGNHDFEYGAEYFSKKAYRRYRPRVTAVSGSKNGAHLFDVAGIHVFAADDANNQFTKEELKAFKKTLADGRPVLFVTHVPFEPDMGDASLLAKSVELFGLDANGHSKALIGNNSVVPNDITRQMMDLALSGDSPVFCVLAGHIHYEHEDMLTSDIPQIVADAAFRSRGVLLHLKGK